jgi:hypothetical protein
MEEINISWCSKLTEVGIIGFLNKTGETLKSLNIGSTGLSFSNVGDLTCSFSMLEEIDVSWCCNLTDVGIIGFLTKTQDTIKILNLSNTFLAFSDLESLACRFSVLEKINLTGCQHLKETEVMGFLNKTGKTLKILNLSNSEVSFSNVGSLSCSFSVMNEINLSYCRNMSDGEIMVFLNMMGDTLKVLNLECTEVSFSNTAFLACSFPALEKIYLYDCYYLSESGIESFKIKTGATRVKVSTTREQF